MSDAVLLERRGPVAWITLNRPDQINAINDAVRAQLPACIRAAEGDPEVRVIVLRGAGPRGFCAGADIKEFREVPSPVAYRQARIHHNWIRPFDEAKKPVIAAVHGYCLGGGLEIALACDIRIATTDATFALPETGLGMITGVGGSQRLVRVVGLGRALDLMLTGERWSARQAFETGLVTRLCEPAQLEQCAADLAARIAGKAPLATAFAKEVLKSGIDLDIAAGMKLETDLVTLLINTEDRQEAARAFVERREAKFTGR